MVEGYRVIAMEWPAQSPDSNPIENLWSILDQRTKKRKLSNEKALFEALVEGWNGLPQSLLVSLVESMPRRIEAVIAAKGYATKYILLEVHFFHYIHKLYIFQTELNLSFIRF